MFALPLSPRSEKIKSVSFLFRCWGCLLCCVPSINLPHPERSSACSCDLSYCFLQVLRNCASDEGQVHLHHSPGEQDHLWHLDRLIFAQHPHPLCAGERVKSICASLEHSHGCVSPCAHLNKRESRRALLRTTVSSHRILWNAGA